MDTYIKSLKSIGLNNTQATVYLKLLEIGKSTITEISRKANIKRPTVHDSIVFLMNSGLVIQAFDDGKKYYIVDTPDKLMQLARQKQEIVQSLLPDFLNLYSKGFQKATVQVMDSVRGSIKAHELALKYHKDFKTYYIGSVVNCLLDVMTEKQILDYVSARVKKGIRNYVITTEDINKKAHMYNEKVNKECLREIKVISSLNFLKADLFVFGDFVNIISTAKDNYVVIIQSEDFASTIKNIFGVLWNMK